MHTSPCIPARRRPVGHAYQPDAERLNRVALDFNGDRVKSVANASEIRLLPATLYNLITL